MILLYSDTITPRLEYIAHLIFNEILQAEIGFTADSDDFLKSDLPKINYSDTRFNDELYIKPHGLLTQKTIEKIDVQSVMHNNLTCLFESSSDSDLPFDIFAASFFCVTRYEEYLDAESDKYGRFPATQSILFKHGVLKKPVVNIWSNWLAAEITKKFPGCVFPSGKFRFISTIDIDNAWAYLNKGIWRTTGAMFKNVFKLNFQELKSRLNVLSGKEQDPYDTYDFLDSVYKGNEGKVKFFFLMGDYGKFDKNIPHRNRNFQKLIKTISGKYDTGIHPSFAAFNQGGHQIIKKESGRLEKITGKNVQKSRQHYLNLKFPETYRNLIKAGISEDFTLGFADHCGFRGGICTPFYFYDLKNDEKSNLLIVPFQVMDGTLLHYLKYKPGEAFDQIKQIMVEVKNVGGTFVSIWHNETVNDAGEWKGYREVFEKTTRLGFQWANE